MNQPKNLTELARLLEDAFPAWNDFPGDCWIPKAIQYNRGDSWEAAIGIVSRNGARADAVRRLQAEHPIGPKHKQYGDRALDVFTEIEAYAWACEVAHLGIPVFSTPPGPDLRAGEYWIEAKSVNPSKEEQQWLDSLEPSLDQDRIPPWRLSPSEEPGAGLCNKFQSDLEVALKQWGGQGRTGKLVVFYCFARPDINVLLAAPQFAIDWARKSEGQARIVICYNHDWRQPIYPGALV